MDLNTINEVARPHTREQLPVWTAGDAWLAGGTWLFSEPQAHLTRLIDLADLKWPALTIGGKPGQTKDAEGQQSADDRGRHRHNDHPEDRSIEVPGHLPRHPRADVPGLDPE